MRCRAWVFVEAYFEHLKRAMSFNIEVVANRLGINLVRVVAAVLVVALL